MEEGQEESGSKERPDAVAEDSHPEKKLRQMDKDERRMKEPEFELDSREKEQLFINLSTDWIRLEEGTPGRQVIEESMIEQDLK